MKKYRRCLVFAGGGFRFGIYLGMYAAARDAGRSPDLLLATCGGAIAAAIIQALPDDVQRKAWLSSPQMYEFWGSLKAARQATIVRTLAQAAQRKFSTGRAARIPDLFNDYLFEVPPPLPLPPRSASAVSAVSAGEVSVATIGGKLLFGPDEVGQLRGQRELFVQTVLCEPRAASLLQGMRSPFANPHWGAHAIAGEVLTDTTFALEEAARLSITDFYYFPCHRHGADHYIGGVIDLFPIEVARRLADEVMIEFKAPFDQTFAIPAWRAVLGLDGNQRLCHVNALQAEAWIDTSDIFRALARQQIHKKLDWRRNRIALSLPDSPATYAKYMDDQWQYGYQRALEALQRTAPGDSSRMRQVNRYNRATAGAACAP